MKQLKNYQEIAVSQLETISKMYFKATNKETIVLQSPTGSGKTFMISNYISRLIEDNDIDVCFLWVSIGNGNLHIQSYLSVKENVSPAVECSLLENDFFSNRNKISRNEIVFLNWEKIRTKDSVTGEYTNVAMSNRDSSNLIDILENTRSIGRKIILIIDESHKSANTARALELRDDILKPFLTIEMSATPVLTSHMSMRVTVDPADVIKEGMIKKEVIINKDIDTIDDNELFSENLVLECAYRKRNELAKKFKEEKANINPLVLIQLPNSDAGEQKKKAVLDFLDSKGIKEADGKIAIWLSEEKVNNETSIIKPNNSGVEYLLFKQAVDTGWDCPRAQILVKFRETSSIVFEIQTVGRILRMPEAKHYLSDMLNTAYVYTNIKSIEVKKEIYNPNIIKSLKSTRKDIYETLHLRSYYRNRVDFGDVTKEYSIFYENAFCRFFDIEYKENDIPDYNECMNKFLYKGVKSDYDEMNYLVNNVNISSNKIDEGIKIVSPETLKLKLSPSELDGRYDSVISKNLNGFAPRRSIPKIKSAILYVFKKYLNIKPADNGIVEIQNIIVRNEEIFEKIISEAINDYKIFHAKDIESKSTERFNDFWEIPASKEYNRETNIELKSTLSLYQPLYMELKNNKIDELEEKFINYLELHKEQINWFWKNGSEHMESNFGIQKENKMTFQPDFIVSFKDGSTGIYDTKGGQYPDDDRIKSNALFKYISEERFKGKNIIGGLVVWSSNEKKFKYYLQATFKSYKESPNLWEDFDNLIK